MFFSEPMLRPAAAMYVLPIVLIFSTQLNLFLESNFKQEQQQTS